MTYPKTEINSASEVFNFNFAANNQLYFGRGKFKLLPKLIKSFGKNLLFIFGGEFFKKTSQYTWLLKDLKNNSTRIYCSSISSEPSPDQVDEIVHLYQKRKIQVVVAIGGGSVIDTGKAVSAMLTKKEPVLDYLESVGTKIHDGEKIPFIAVPTTAGTGSEATQNAVLGHVSEDGFKKSLRHLKLVPDIAVVDPELTISCPGEITAACGMDALTQLIGSYVSIKASPMTDALALSGIGAMGNAILKSVITDPSDIKARTMMCYGSYISGLTLANAGLGTVHGFAAVIGGYFHVPHGLICGTLLAQVTQKNIETLIKLNPESKTLLKYASVGKLLGKTKENNAIENARALSILLKEWTEILKIPLLRKFGIGIDHVDKIVSAMTQKNNPIVLKKEDLKEILKSRI